MIRLQVRIFPCERLGRLCYGSVGLLTSKAQVLRAPIAFHIEGMIDRVFCAIELQLLHPSLLTWLDTEGRGRLDRLPLKIQ